MSRLLDRLPQTNLQARHENAAESFTLFFEREACKVEENIIGPSSWEQQVRRRLSEFAPSRYGSEPLSRCMQEVKCASVQSLAITRHGYGQEAMCTRRIGVPSDDRSTWIYAARLGNSSARKCQGCKRPIFE